MFLILSKTGFFSLYISELYGLKGLLVIAKRIGILHLTNFSNNFLLLSLTMLLVVYSIKYKMTFLEFLFDFVKFYHFLYL